MFVIVYTTVGSEKEAEKIASIIVSEGLAACVNRFPIKSTYTWKGKTVCDNEHALLCKTTSANFQKIKKRIKELHSYDTPCVLSIKISAGDEKYLNWIRKAVR